MTRRKRENKKKKRDWSGSFDFDSVTRVEKRVEKMRKWEKENMPLFTKSSYLETKIVCHLYVVSLL